MRRSVHWPPRVVAGRMAMHPDPDRAGDPNVAVSQIVALSLLDARSTNPWNRGLGISDPAFKSANQRDVAAIRAAVTERFRALERSKRARLISVGVSRVAATATTSIRIEYENLETGERLQLETSVNA